MSFSSEQPFKIAVLDDAIAQLKRKLSDVRFPDELDDAGWDYGAPLADIKRLTERWRDGYDWRVHEAKLNELPMFTRDIEVDGFGVLNLHYVHQQSTVENAIPLLFSYGWPGSFVEVSKILPLLTAASPDHPSFHVVAPSLPGYGFSEGIRKPGFRGVQYAELFNKLMLSLGYNEYVTQGGDWGHVLTRITAAKYGPKHVKASHSNMPFGVPAPSLRSAPFVFLRYLLTPSTPEEKADRARSDWFVAHGLGYMALLSTAPQTIAYALADSPVGVLAWIYEKLVAVTDAYPWEDDEVLTWISIFWFSRAGPGASSHIYYELSKSGEMANSRPSPVPVGFSVFPKEPFVPPRSWIHGAPNVVFVKEHKEGGHFAAYEKPQALVDDVRAMFGMGGPAAGVVPGKSGYTDA
ncbi:alpha/beta-hydrolase [Auriscalpium vulgare]|uniref:Alpha/beta-hydrolase n=1 Tax=Auriscalpium vulgare TaxID=40419 RepID=A0ACB8RYH7_9AGAM|nr:alpha/beta-hydrolase [Auriscalpium vulgare]